MTRSSWAVTAAIAGLAVLVRVFYVLLLRDHPLFDHPNMDAGYHLAWAEALARGETFQEGPFFRAPLYPAFLAGLVSVLGEGTLGPRLAQACLGGVTAGLTHRIGLRLFGPAAAIVAGLFVALSMVLVAFDAELLIPTLFIPLTLLALHLALGWGFDGRPRAAALTGLAFGLAAIARPNVLLFMPVAFAIALWRSRGWRAPLALTLGTIAAVAPVTIHNAMEGDATLVATQAGVNFWIGNNPQSDGSTAVVPGTPDGWWEGYYGAISLAERAEGRTLRATEVSAHYTGRALDWMRQDPASAFRHLLWKARLLVTNVELANNSDVAFTARTTMPVLAWTPSRWDVLFGLGLVGLVIGRRQRISGAGVLLSYLLVYGATIVLFFVSARFRAPLLPVLALGAGHGAVQLVAALRSREWGAAAAIALPAAGLALASNIVPGSVDQGDASGLMNLGLAEIRRGDPAAALEHLELAYSANPTHPQVRYQLAYALRLTGGSTRRILGLVTLPEELARTPAGLDLETLRLEVLLETEGPAAVMDRVDELLTAMPGTSKLRMIRATALARSGQIDAALRALAEQARDEPQSPDPHYVAGQLLQSVGRRDEARAAFGAVLERERFCAPVVLQDVRARLEQLE